MDFRLSGKTGSSKSAQYNDLDGDKTSGLTNVYNKAMLLPTEDSMDIIHSQYLQKALIK